MKLHEFYAKYANVPLANRSTLLSNDYSSPLLGMTLIDVYKEIKAIDDKQLDDNIRREKLLVEVEKFLTTDEK